MPKLLILANCIHWSLATALENSGFFSRVDSHALFLLSSEQRLKLLETVHLYDYVLTLQHNSNYGELSTESLKAKFGERILSVPTPFFSGLTPDICYLTYSGSLSRSSSVLGDYHSSIILTEMQSGTDKQETVRRYVSGESFDLLDIKGVWNDNIEELVKRDQLADIKLMPYIESSISSRIIATDFFTFNHPSENIVNYIAHEFIRQIFSTQLSKTLIDGSSHSLSQGVFCPMHPVVADCMELPRSSVVNFKQPSEFGNGTITLEEFAASSYDFFATHDDLSKFVITTPRYLQSRQMNRKQVQNVNTKQNLPISSHSLITKVCLIHFGRSGSTLLKTLLDEHPSMRWHGEIFNNRVSSISSNSNLSEIMTYINSLLEPEANNIDKVVVGFEVKLLDFLPNLSCGFEEFLEELQSQGYKFILLRRVNTLARITSSIKAEISGIYHAFAHDKETQAKISSTTVNLANGYLRDYDTGATAQSVCELLRLAQEREEQVKTYLSKLSRNYLYLVYENDIVDNPQLGYTKVTDYLNLPALPIKNVFLTKTGRGLNNDISNFEEVKHELQFSEFSWMLESPEQMPYDKQNESSKLENSNPVSALLDKPIFKLLKRNIPISTLRLQDSQRWAFQKTWSNDDTDLDGVMHALHSLWDAQSVSFMIDLIPYFTDILRDDDNYEYWVKDVLSFLDVGARTAAGSDLLGSLFFGGACRRQAYVDVLDIDSTFADYVKATKRFVRDYLVMDIAQVPDKSYDYVFASHVIEHISDPLPFCNELRRIAKKKVICYLPFDESNPISDHHTVDLNVLRRLGAKNIQTTDRSFHWKHPDKHQFTAMFYLD